MSHFKFTTEPDARLNCSVCLSTMSKPVTLTCGHSGCQDCLAKLVAIEDNPRCPLCKREFKKDAPLNVNVVLDDISGQLKVQCTNNGCMWKGVFESVSDHSNQCPKLELLCSNIGCREKVCRGDMAAHRLQCPKEKVPCMDCGKIMARDSLMQHTTMLCSFNRIPCPLGCGTHLPRCHFTLHQSECSEKAVKCTVVGCNTITKRKNQAEHVKQAASSHAVLQGGEVQRLRRIIHFKTRKPSLIMCEESLFSFCWKVPDWKELEGSVSSTEYRCTNGNRWRGIIKCKDRELHVSAQLLAATNPVMVGVRIVLMPDTSHEKVFPFPTGEVKEGELVGRATVQQATSAIPDGTLSVKYVVSYCNLI